MPEEEGQEEQGNQEEQEGQEQEPSAPATPELPDEFKSLKPEQVGPTLSLLYRTVQMQGQQLEDLRRSATPGHAREPEDPKKKYEDVDLKTLIYDDPEKAVLIAFEKNFGSLVERLETGSAMGSWVDARSRLTGFSEREQKVRDLIQARGFDPNRANPLVIEDAYYYVVGQETLANQSRNRDKGPKSEKPTPSRSAPVKAKKEFENETEEAIFKASGLTEEEYWELRNKEALEVEVPSGR